MYVKFNDLNSQWKLIVQPTIKRLNNLFNTSQYINGKDVKIFEENFASYIGTKYCIGVSNGTDAIKLSIKALEIKYNIKNCLILIPANTFIATYLGVKQAIFNSEIKLIDCDEYYQIDIKLIEKELKTNRHKYDHCLIIGVHLFGYCCDVENILKLCNQYNCIFIEDSAQAHGTITNLGNTGSIGEISAFSFYPGKNLGACGDAGGITTNNKDLYDIIQSLKNFGIGQNKYVYNYEGYNNRLDTLQAIILDEKLKFLDEWNENRINTAKIYNENLNSNLTPKVSNYCKKHTYHLYVIQTENRNNLIEYLKENNIETGIHYPIPIEKTGLFNNYTNNLRTIELSHKILSLPIHPFITKSEVSYISDKINEHSNISLISG